MSFGGFLIQDASAAVADAAPKQNPILSLVPILVIVVVFYFFIIRPQQKRLKAEQKMREALRVGDKVVTTSGIFGSVTAIDDAKGVVSLEISKGVIVTLYKATIAEILTLDSGNAGAKDEKNNENRKPEASNK